MATRDKLALLGGIAIGDEGQEVGTHARVVEQGVALGGGAVGRHFLACAFGCEQELQQIGLDPLGLCLKAPIIADVTTPRVDSCLSCRPTALATSCFPLVGALGEYPQATAMSGEMLQVEDLQSVRPKMP